MGGRARRIVTEWVAPLCVATALVAVATTVTRAPQLDPAIAALFPRDPGTTWMYSAKGAGVEGQVVVEVTGQSLSGEDGVGALTIETRSDPALPLPRRRQRSLVRTSRGVGLRTDTIDGQARDIEPPRPLLQAPLTAGAVFTWRGQVDGAIGSVKTTVVGRERVDAAGRAWDGCVHLMRSGDVTEEEWDCPGVGMVRQLVGLRGSTLDVTLAAFRSPDLAAGPRLREDDTASADAGQAHEAPLALARPVRVVATVTPRGALAFPPTGGGGIVITTSKDGTVAAVDVATGRERWSLRLAAGVVAPPVIAGGVVLTGDGRRALFALDLQTGSTVWATRFSDVVSATPAVHNGVVVVATDDRSVSGLALDDGHTVWHVGGTGLVITALAASDAGVVVADVAGTVTTYDAASGRVRWRASLLAPLASGPQATSGTIVAVDRDHDVVAFRSDNGAVRWSRAMPALLFSPAVAPDIVVMTVRGGRVAALDPASGRPAWTRSLGAEATAGPWLVGPDVVVPAADRALHVVSRAGGRAGPPVTPPPGATLGGRLAAPLSYMDGALIVTAARPAGLTVALLAAA